MKKILLLVCLTIMSIFYSFSQSSYTFESLSTTNPNITYIATITYNPNNSATVSRTSRPSIPGDKVYVFVDLLESDYSVDATCFNLNIQSETGFIYYIEENVLLGVQNGGPNVCVDCGCSRAAEGGEGNPTCTASFLWTPMGKSGGTLNVSCSTLNNCSICTIVNVGTSNPGDSHNSGAVIFKAISATN